ncbi:PREDICTED: SH3 domain-binding glutamic acid-rich-like protein 3 isoform X1 [Colobus angolensis palliatus]|uniref:SH3 domain-binding glutamic acid-rich-like protein 3 n=3 Tax=Cercopithecidae TaxID=9527 RepID=A0A2K5Y3T6_MANLE|nr:PREDICTED: SH3 domain-binding glutamic acid-rich-like protein 3 isoform X1 [Colobus angolensis palliatus]
MSGLRVYSTSVTGSREIKSQQSEVTRILDGKRIQYQLVDISQDNALRDEMRALAGNPKATPPQIVNGDQYCGVWAGGLGGGGSVGRGLWPGSDLPQSTWASCIQVTTPCLPFPRTMSSSWRPWNKTRCRSS